MLRKETYLNALMAAKLLSESGRYIRARDGSLIGELVRSSASIQTLKTTKLPKVIANPPLESTSSTDNMENRAEDVVFNTNDGEELSDHSKRIAGIIEDISPKVLSHISFARNEVAPKVTALADKLTQFAQDAKPLDPSSQFCICQYEIPGLMLDEGFVHDNIAQYNGVQAKAPNFDVDIDFDALDDGFYGELTNMGSDRLNTLVRQWLSTQPENFFKEVLLHSIGGKPYDDAYAKKTLDYSLYAPRNVYEDMNVHLGVYIIATHLFASPPKTKNRSLQDFKITMRAFMTYAGARLAGLLKTAARQQETNVLVIEAIPVRKCIGVAKATYQKWLSEGGSPEILFGMLVSGKTTFSVTATQEQKEVYIRAWNNYVMLSQTDVKLDLRNRFIAFLKNEVILGCDELTDFEQEYHKTGVPIKEKVLAHLEDELKKLPHNLMTDINHTALHAIAKGRFWFTSSYEILSEMVTVSKENPTIDPREAALLSTIKYFVEYASDQLELVK